MQEKISKLFKNKKMVYLIASSLVLVVLCLIVTFLVIFNTPKVKAIDFSKLKKEEILQWVEKANIDKSKIELKFDYSDTVLKDNLISQSVMPNNYINNKLILIISEGPNPDREVEIPINYKSMSYAQFSKWAKDNHLLNVNYKYQNSDNLAKDMIISLDKTGKIKRSDVLNVVISNGQTSLEKDEVLILDFNGYTKEKIEKWAKQHEIDVSYRYETSSSIEKDYVISQNPSKDSKVKKGSSIVIKISLGSEIKLENLKGKDLDYVKEYAKKYSLNLKVEYQTNSDYQHNVVFKQDPDAFETVKSDSNLTVYIAKNNSSDKVDGFDYVNKSETALKTFIKDYNLNINRIEEYHSSISKGNIIYHDKEFTKNGNFTYYVSIGDYIDVVSASNFNQKTEDQINDQINKDNKIEAKITFEKRLSNSVENDGKAHNCKYESRMLVCEFYQGSDQTTDQNDNQNENTQLFNIASIKASIGANANVSPSDSLEKRKEAVQKTENAIKSIYSFFENIKIEYVVDKSKKVGDIQNYGDFSSINNKQLPKNAEIPSFKICVGESEIKN